MQGSCLCGCVTFRVSIDALKIYQCFCSLCQKQSGTESNLATIVADSAFEFLSGEEQITTWVKDTGFTSHFCKNCGSPVPNRLRNKPFYWVPVGAFDGEFKGEVISHIYTASKPGICLSDQVEQFPEFPDGGIDSHIGKISGV